VNDIAISKCFSINFFRMSELTSSPSPFCRFLRNPTELKSIKNISLLRQQMEAQAAASKIAAQQQQQQQAAAAAAAAVAAVTAATPPPPFSAGPADEPTDLTITAEEKDALRRRERERYLNEAKGVATSNGQQRSSSPSSEERDEPPRSRPRFDFRTLMPPQVSVKTSDSF